ncbi:uncharacterized protein PG998_009982 [Apiospora kogelbergensis]|uniref:uncharacterized protein n=1 Tax=Apiospora kogelbergensis TaxID=1337665 RepID=UPI00312E9432
MATIVYYSSYLFVLPGLSARTEEKYNLPGKGQPGSNYGTRLAQQEPVEKAIGGKNGRVWQGRSEASTSIRIRSIVPSLHDKIMVPPTFISMILAHTSEGQQPSWQGHLVVMAADHRAVNCECVVTADACPQNTDMECFRYDDGEVTRYGAGESYRPFNDRADRERPERPERPERAERPDRPEQRRPRSPPRAGRSPPPRERARTPPALDNDRYIPDRDRDRDRTPRRRSRSPGRFRRDRSREREADRPAPGGDSWRRPRERTRSPARRPSPPPQRRSPIRRNSPPPRRFSPDGTLGMTGIDHDPPGGSMILQGHNTLILTFNVRLLLSLQTFVHIPILLSPVLHTTTHPLPPRGRSRSPLDNRDRGRDFRGDLRDRERRSPGRRPSPPGPRVNNFRRRSPSMDRRDDRFGPLADGSRLLANLLFHRLYNPEIFRDVHRLILFQLGRMIGHAHSPRSHLGPCRDHRITPQTDSVALRVGQRLLILIQLLQGHRHVGQQAIGHLLLDPETMAAI